MSETYEQVTARAAVELYLTARREEDAAPSAITIHRSRLGYFEDWFASDSGDDHLHELSGLDVRRRDKPLPEGGSIVLVGVE